MDRSQLNLPCTTRTRRLILCAHVVLLALIAQFLIASRACAQERTFGAAIPEAESYPRGAFVDEQYADMPGWSAWPFGPWRFFGGYPGWLGPGPWGWRNAFLAPRYAPFAYQYSPYYEWPYEWSYEPMPPDAGAFGPIGPQDFGPFHEQPRGPRRLYW